MLRGDRKQVLLCRDRRQVLLCRDRRQVLLCRDRLPVLRRLLLGSDDISRLQVARIAAIQRCEASKHVQS